MLNFFVNLHFWFRVEVGNNNHVDIEERLVAQHVIVSVKVRESIQRVNLSQCLHKLSAASMQKVGRVGVLIQLR